ncbi:MAE_28990/MAE_18760 family HEPN-like nuclease [Dolichospermum sp. UHCC 0352]|uniref:MAE_28990/MAE_18760 family HEPN-like nuclease n=1 Tax=Dolichospermum sp. UHCC 0352 TaxID=2590011 RepID=UPI0020C44B74|nr:MAE_28990/MAE_18760 family HEPN-like nuclease [Dolichospermum sp. UHCC 0352]
MAVKANISTIRSIIKTNEKIREIAFRDVSLRTEEIKQLLINISQDIPELTDWRVYDHCAVVTRLYAIYETFVEDLIEDWLILLPSLYSNYSDLEKTIRKTHQNGVGRLLQEILKEDNHRYKNLSIQQVMYGLLNGETGKDKYELLPDAFLFHEQNLRKNSLERLLANAGIFNSWSWVVKHRDVKYFIEEIRANENSLEQELNTLISYRNEAAHGTDIDNWLAANALLELCDFVESLCQALTELVNYQVLERKKSIGQAQEIGRITRWFDQIQVAVLKPSDSCLLSVGGSLFLVGDSYCQPAKIESIRNQNDESINEIETTPGMEVKLKFDIDARKNLCLYQLIT